MIYNFFKQKTALFSILTFALAAFLTVLASPPAEAYNGARLIDDAVFRNTNSMTKSQIQAFLDARNVNNSSTHIANRSFKFDCYSQNSQEREWYTAIGAPCDKTVKASEIIYYVSRVYGINPQATMATLQKEQSLITTSNPTQSQLDWAMGYGCPTESGCPNGDSFRGFYYQVDHGVWVLRLHFERARGNMGWWRTHSRWVCGSEKNFYKPDLYPGSNVRFFDEDGVHYRTYTLANAATSSLYCYTPHAYNNPQGLHGLPKYGTTGRYYSGSYNFVTRFEAWFGSTQGTPFFRIGNTSPVYILGANDNYYRIPSMGVLQAYGFGTTIQNVANMDESHIEGLQNSGTLPLLVRFQDSSAVYLIDNGRRHHFTSGAMVTTFGYTLPDDRAVLPEQVKLYLPKGPNMQTVIRERGGAPVFFIENGQKRHIVDQAAFDSGDPAYSSLPRITLSKFYLSTLDTGSVIIAPNNLLRHPDSGAFSFWNGTALQNIQKETVAAMGVSHGYSVHTNNVKGLETSPEPVDRLAKSSTGQLFILDSRKKLLVSPENLEQLGLTTDDFIPTANRFLNLVKTEHFSTAVRINNGAAIFLIKDGQRHHFSSREAMSEHGYTASDVVNINSRSAQLFPNSGRAILATGTLFRIGDAATVYLINDFGESLRIPTRTVFDEYGFSPADVLRVSPKAVAGYPEAGVLGHFVRRVSNENQFWLIHSGRLRAFVSSEMSSGPKYNLTADNIPIFMSHIITSYTAGGVHLTDLIRASGDPKIYLIENGQKRWVTSQSAFNTHGGNDNLTEVSRSFVNSLPSGPNLN